MNTTTTTLATLETSEVIAAAPLLPDSRSPVPVYLSRLGGRTARVAQSDLHNIAAILSGGRLNCFVLDWSQVRYQHVNAVRARLVERYAPTTARRMLCSLRGVLRETWRLGLMTAEDYHRACDIAAVPGDRLPTGRQVPMTEKYSLFMACGDDDTAAGRRDAAILAIGFGCGLRRDEISRLSFDDYDAGTGELRVLHGKGNKQRVVYMGRDGRDALNEWLQIRGNEPGPLFYRILKGGRVVPVALSNQAVYNVLSKRAGEANVSGLKPHDMRRTLASDLLDDGADIATVAKILGHASITTTQRYDMRPERAKQDAAELVRLPFVRRSML